MKIKQIKEFLIPFIVSLVFLLLPFVGVSNGVHGEDWQAMLGRTIGNIIWLGLSEMVVGSIILITIVLFIVHKKWLRITGVLSAVLLFCLWFFLCW